MGWSVLMIVSWHARTADTQLQHRDSLVLRCFLERPWKPCCQGFPHIFFWGCSQLLRTQQPCAVKRPERHVQVMRHRHCDSAMYLSLPYTFMTQNSGHLAFAAVMAGISMRRDCNHRFVSQCSSPSLCNSHPPDMFCCLYTEFQVGLPHLACAAVMAGISVRHGLLSQVNK